MLTWINAKALAKDGCQHDGRQESWKERLKASLGGRAAAGNFSKKIDGDY